MEFVVDDNIHRAGQYIYTIIVLAIVISAFSSLCYQKIETSDLNSVVSMESKDALWLNHLRG